MINAHNEIIKERLKLQSYYVGLILAGKNLDDLEDNKILGIDKPVEPSMLSNFY